jgi:hypothetical protein
VQPCQRLLDRSHARTRRRYTRSDILSSLCCALHPSQLLHADSTSPRRSATALNLQEKAFVGNPRSIQSSTCESGNSPNRAFSTDSLGGR